MIILGIDYETTIETNQSDNVPIELGFCLYDTKLKKMLTVNSIMLNDEHRVRALENCPAATKLSGITPEDLKVFGYPAHSCYKKLIEYSRYADAIAAYNGVGFDFKLLEKELRLVNLEGLIKFDIAIDYMYDLPLSAFKGSRALTYLGADHGIINMFPHRAVFDVVLMLRIADSYDYEDIVKSSKTQMATMVATSGTNQDYRACGFYWNKPNWVREVRNYRVPELTQLCIERNVLIKNINHQASSRLTPESK